jgi:hypothetical protein
VLKIPEGYGTRHASIAGITQMTNAIGFVVSTTGEKISIIKNGEIKKAFVVWAKWGRSSFGTTLFCVTIANDFLIRPKNETQHSSHKSQ